VGADIEWSRHRSWRWQRSSTSVAVSLDGFVARPDVDLDWLGRFMASGDDYTGSFIASMDALLTGRGTYAESDQTMQWFGQGPYCGKPV
jgi:hypothetical protein